MDHALEQQLTLALRDGPMKLSALVATTGRTRIEVNKVLYTGMDAGLFKRVKESPPVWALVEVKTEAAAKAGGGTLVLLDTGGLPNLLLPLARLVLEDETVTAVAPLDANTNPKGVNQNAKPEEKALVARALETKRFEMPQSAAMVPEYADAMLAVRAGMWLATRTFGGCVVVGHDKHNQALAAVLPSFAAAGRVDFLKTEAEFHEALGI